MLQEIKNKAEKAIKEAQTLKELNRVFKDFLGKKGELSLVLRGLKNLSEKERIKKGKESNELKGELKIKFEKRKGEIGLEGQPDKEKGIDVTIPGKKPLIGHLSPLTQVKRQIIDIFRGMGFEVIDGPEIEKEWYNFDALNIPKDHPARDAWDTFWLKGKDPLLLRTHTSPSQIRYMEKHQPPLRIIAPGKGFRHEATDASHEMQFYQVEGLMVGEDVSAANFKAVVKHFFESFFGQNINIRFTPDYFPFTEPSFEVAMSCLICGGKGCPACKNTGWIEIGGAGMVHPNVFKHCKLDSDKWQGWAFGFGIDRLTMMKYKINDIRLIHSGDLRFLNQF